MDKQFEFSLPELTDLTETEWWMLFEQINNKQCMVTDADWKVTVTTDIDSVIHRNEHWQGYIITPGTDVYFTRGRRVREGVMQFWTVRKLNEHEAWTKLNNVTMIEE